MVALDGGVFSFGDAHFYGSLGDVSLHEPILGITPTPDGKGYWMYASDGGVFSFGDARFFGSTGNMKLTAPVVGMAATTSGAGYWLVAGDGGSSPSATPRFHGSLGATTIDGWIVGMAPTLSGSGYWLADANGAVYHLGDTLDHGNNLSAPRTEPIAQIQRTPDGGGYWLLEPDTFPTAFSSPGGGGRIVAVAASQVRANPVPGYFCNPYGPCEQWCSRCSPPGCGNRRGGHPRRWPSSATCFGWALTDTPRCRRSAATPASG